MTKSKILVLGLDPYQAASIFMMIVSLLVGLSAIAGLKKVGNDPPEVDSQLTRPNHLADLNPPLTKLCFVRDDWIYLMDLTTGRETKLVEGTVPDLSREGDAIVFMSPTDSKPIKDAKNFYMHSIKILDVRTNEIQPINTLSNLYASHPRWSSDGSRIAFQVVSADETRLDIAVLNRLTGKWEEITENIDFGKPAEPIYLDSWVGGDQSILFHSLEFLYEVRVDGTLVQKLSLDEIGVRGEVSSATRFSFSSDKRFLLFDRIEDTSSNPESAVISILDLNNKQVSNITPRVIDSISPIWLPSDEILFTCLNGLEQPRVANLCKITRAGSDLTTVILNAHYASFSLR